MAKPDAAELGQRALRLGLLTQPQLEQGLEEARDKNADPHGLVRVLERKGYLTPFQSAKLLKGDGEGYFLGGYRLLYRISSGSFGRVFRADDPASGRVVAVKVLRRRWSEDPKTVESFYREARLGAGLRHGNIVEVLAVNQDPGSRQHYIVMEFVEGGNLREILKVRKKVPVAEALRLIEDATKGLVYAFARGVTHRDMKLTNILISSQGDAKLVDFGLAVVSGGLAGRATGGSDDADPEHVDRTVDYAGLERATATAPGDTRSDIYFLGCVLYEMLTGRAPLEWTKDVRARMSKQRFENVKPFARDEIEAPPSLFNLVETMMSLDPRHRYQTPAQLLEAVRAARRDAEGGATAPAETKKKTGGSGFRHKSGAAQAQRSIFIIERNQKAQEKLRDKFKELGYRVFVASDPMRALDRFRTMPFDALVINAGSVGEDGLSVFQSVLDEAKAKSVACSGVLILSLEQADWQRRVADRPGAAVLLPPATIKRLCEKLDELMTA
jgi:serine/threonine protein kinase